MAVLVTSLDEVAFPPQCMALLYSERGDAENVYDELKNQWGWGGYTSKRLGPCRIAALLGGTARLLKHAGQRTVRVSLQHDKSDVIQEGILKVSSFYISLKPLQRNGLGNNAGECC